MKHTPGPWETRYSPHQIEIFAPDKSRSITSIFLPPAIYDTEEANAHLISKAPEMYELLTELEAYFADRADAEYHTDGPPSGNEEMSLLVQIQEVLFGRNFTEFWQNI